MARFTPDFLDELRTRLRASDIIGRHVKLKKEGREFRGLSPFTQEKTPSFYVNDEKGRYFDFSSGKSGDIVGFLMDTHNLSFPEAVTSLAELAGMELPQDSPEDRQREEKAKGLAEACLDAAKFFRNMLNRSEGQTGKDYFDRRRVSEAARKKFGLGFAPDSRTALKDYLLNKDYPPALLVEAGLLIQPDDGGAPYDRFRGRVMFPILGPRDRVIAFGGRALSKSTKAKYLNSPETPLFHKSNTLYNLGAARKRAAASKRPLIVAEGYMDVIAIAEIGWPAVAPLGTALTEAQLSLLWKSQDNPILCFDGDRAGKAAAYRAIDRALPLLSPGKSLGFAFLPEGLDPDDLIKNQGADAFDALLAAPKPLAEVLWDRECETQPRTTPEEQAQFRRHLRELVRSIADADVRRAYGDYIADKMGDARPSTPLSFAPAPTSSPMEGPPDYPSDFVPDFAPDYGADDPHDYAPAPPASGHAPRGQQAKGQKGSFRPGQFKGGKGNAYGDRRAPGASDALKAAVARRAGPAQADMIREALLVVGLVKHPKLFDRHEDAVLSLQVADPGLGTLLACCVDTLMSNPDLDTAGLTTHILSNPTAGEIYNKWLDHTLVRLAQLAKSDTTFDVAEQHWLNALAIDKHGGELESEMRDAAADSFKDEGQERIWRDTVALRSRLIAESKSDDGPS